MNVLSINKEIFKIKSNREIKTLTMKSSCIRYCSGSTTIDAPPAKIKLTEGNISPTLNIQ